MKTQQNLIDGPVVNAEQQYKLFTLKSINFIHICFT